MLVSESNAKYKLLHDDSVNGVKMQLFSNFDDEIAEVIDRENVVSLMLSQWLGWKYEQLDFLSKLTQLKALYIFDSTIKDISKVSDLVNLEVLYLECPRLKIGFNASRLCNLKDVRIDWKPCLKNIAESSSIKVLLLSGFKEESLTDFLPLNISRLDLIRPSKLKTLDGLEKLSQLNSISLYQCRKLESIDAIASLSLSSIEIEGCKQVKGLSKLLTLSGLESLVIENCANIESISGISTLSKLQKLRIASTTIMDGDLSELVGMRISSLFFDRKKSYSHSLEEIRKSTSKEILLRTNNF
ncbi:hypothetical protein L1285_18815 [Pseudoalteromonas sp. DL2-H2.2]|uniref:hypothetical protein n=1 Tax=Pseudoalteromonas sp. DL2-H2.2 TaxID=2908889 RepID=UPI001F2E7A03|nr:hypothetical protein [Pseudoalteromonas sp. DL2-H2.2]MCF2910369.1 hypothetical protein [Pseudoalteromonas sp. DL2-H2.2]